MNILQHLSNSSSRIQQSMRPAAPSQNSTRMGKLIKYAREGNTSKFMQHQQQCDLKNDRDEENNTILHHGCFGGAREIVALIIQTGISVNSYNVKKETSLHVACDVGSTSVIPLLLNAGANPNQANNIGETPLFYACRSGQHVSIASLFGSATYRLDVDHQAMDGTTPLMWASTKSASTVKILFNNKASPTLRSHDGSSPLHWACFHGTIEIVKTLLDYLVPINVSDEEGNSPLHIACKRGDANIVRELIRREARINCLNKAGKTPCNLAEERNHHDCVNIIHVKLGTSTGSLQEEIAQLNQLNQEMKDEVTGLRRTLSQIQEEKMILQEKVLTLSEEQKRREEELLEIYVAIAQGADDAGLSTESYRHLQLIRRAISQRRRVLGHHQLTLDVFQENDVEKLRNIGNRRRELRLESIDEGKIEVMMSSSEILNRGLLLIEEMDHRWKHLMAIHEDREASERCRLSKEEFQVQFEAWKDIENFALENLKRCLDTLAYSRAPPLGEKEINAIFALVELLPSIHQMGEYQRFLNTMALRLGTTAVHY